MLLREQHISDNRLNARHFSPERNVLYNTYAKEDSRVNRNGVVFKKAKQLSCG